MLRWHMSCTPVFSITGDPEVSESRRTKLKVVSMTRPPPAAPGRVVHDSRGNAVWSWAIDTDVTTNTGLLRALSPSSGELSLEGEAAPAAGWQGDPYNRSR